MTIKLVVTDLDGTLLDSNDTISAANIDAFHCVKDKGILTVVATGRMACESEYAVRAIGALPYFIGVNGGLVENLQTKEVIYENHLENTIAVRLCELLDAKKIFFQVYMDAGVVCTPEAFEQIDECGIAKGYLKRFKDSILVHEVPELYGHKIYKILMITADLEAIALVKEEIEREQIPVDFVTSLKNYYEIVPCQLDKSVGLRMLCDHLGIGLEEVLAFGDSANDLEMLRASGISVAVSNGDQSVKAVADYISKSNDDDGVKYGLEKFLL